MGEITQKISGYFSWFSRMRIFFHWVSEGRKEEILDRDKHMLSALSDSTGHVEISTITEQSSQRREHRASEDKAEILVELLS